jgi:hypothetical protein
MLQPGHGFALLHQHVVEQQHQAPLKLIDGPAWRLQIGEWKLLKEAFQN